MRNRYIAAIFIFISLTSLLSASLDITYDNDLTPHINIEDSTTTISGNISTFLDLTDTPSTYSGQAGLVATVNPGETALIFSAGGGGGGITNISEAGDVDVSGVSDNDVLKWSDALQLWIDSSMNSILSFPDGWHFFSGVNEISFNETKLNESIIDVASIYNNTGLINSVNSSLQTEILERIANDSNLQTQIDLKLNITDQRYNNTGLINSVNSSLQTEILERIANDSFLQDTKLNITDQRYNETDLIPWEIIGNNLTPKDLSNDMVISNGSFETKFRSHQSRAGMEVVNGTVRIGGQWP